VKHPQGVEIDDYGFTIIDLTSVGHKDKPWVLVATVAQVFYILHPKDKKKYIVVPEKQQVAAVEDVEDEEEYNQCDEVPFFVDTRRINIISYPVFMPKPSTHRMCAQDHLFHTHRPQVFTDNQMSQIKYIYYINNISKD
jgi:hypothetical protein